MSAAEPTERPRLGWRIAAVLGAILALYVFAQDVDWLLNYAGLTEHGDFGVLVQPTPEKAPGTGIARVVQPGSPADAAGIVPGDRVQADPWRTVGQPSPGDRLPVTVEHQGVTRVVTLTAGSSRRLTLPGDPGVQLITDLSNIPAALLGLFVLIRSRARPATVLLGVALATFGLTTSVPSPSIATAPIVYAAVVLNTALAFVQYATFPAFALCLLADVGGVGRWTWRAFAAFVATLAFIQFNGLIRRFGGTPLFDFIPRGATWGVLTLVSLTITLIALIVGWRKSPPAEKGRFAILVLAFSAILANQTWIDLLGLRYGMAAYEHFGEWHMLLADVAAGVVAPILFGYAILRHRVLDLGFALNRTLVYSAVSAILLAAFGLIEWAVDHFVTIEGREQNALIDAAIALGVFLTFHRVRDFVEHAVEGLFFRRWQEKEADLRKFVREAAFFTRRAPLLKGFAGALSRFADGAEAAIYLAGETGGFVRAEGRIATAPAAIDDDDAALVSMRAERKPVELADAGSGIGAALWAPMIHRGELIGFVLLGTKAQSAGYRPDEIELIGWAAVQVGLDLHALEVEHLQSRVARLENQLEGVRLTGQRA